MRAALPLTVLMAVCLFLPAGAARAQHALQSSLGRHLGLGWGDGYHAVPCNRFGCPPQACPVSWHACNEAVIGGGKRSAGELPEPTFDPVVPPLLEVEGPLQPLPLETPIVAADELPPTRLTALPPFSVLRRAPVLEPSRGEQILAHASPPIRRLPEVEAEAAIAEPEIRRLPAIDAVERNTVRRLPPVEPAAEVKIVPRAQPTDDDRIVPPPRLRRLPPVTADETPTIRRLPEVNNTAGNRLPPTGSRLPATVELWSPGWSSTR